MNEIITQLHLLDYLNVGLVLVLFAIGFIIKHTPSLKKVDNKYIPYVLVVVSLIYNLATLNIYTKITIINSITDSVISAAIAIGLHQYAKSIIIYLSKTNILKWVVPSEDEVVDDEDDIEDE